MAGHFDCIGVHGEDGFWEFLGVATERGNPRQRADGGRELVWRDPSGATVAVDTDADGELECARPSFLGTSRLPVLVNGLGEDAECRFCARLIVDVLDEQGELVYPLAVELEEVDAVRDAVPAGERRTLRVTAFADSIEVWPDEQAYVDANADEEVSYAAQSLIPVGFFGDPPKRGLFRRRAVEEAPEALALLTGIVASVEERRNEVSGTGFLWAEIDTFGGCYDAVVAVDESEGFVEGAVVRLEAWLIGSLEPA